MSELAREDYEQTPQELLLEYIALRDRFFSNLPDDYDDAEEERFKKYARKHASTALRQYAIARQYI